jgi:hypothetical protein
MAKRFTVLLPSYDDDNAFHYKPHLNAVTPSPLVTDGIRKLSA